MRKLLLLAALVLATATAQGQAPLTLQEAQASARFYFNQADSLTAELDRQRLAYEQLKRCLINEIDYSQAQQRELDRVRHQLQRQHPVPTYYPRPKK